MMNNAAPVDSVGHKIKRNVLPPDSLYICVLISAQYCSKWKQLEKCLHCFQCHNVCYCVHSYKHSHLC